MSFVEQIDDYRLWFKNGGLPWAVAQADDGIAWKKIVDSQATTRTDDDRFSRAMSNGLEVQVASVGGDPEHMFRFWTPDGRPTTGSRQLVFGSDGKLNVTVIARKSEVAGAAETHWQESYALQPAADGTGTFSISVMTGDWQDRATLNLGDSVDVDSTSYVLTDTPLPPGIPLRQGTAVTLEYAWKPDTELTVVAVDRDGKQHGMSGISDVPIQPELEASMHILDPGRKPDNRQTYPYSFDLAPAAVDHFVLKTRPWTKCTFTGIAMQPITSSVTHP
jgi:hypothetical protein